MSSRPLPERAVRRLLADAEPLLAELTVAPERVGKYRIVRLIGRGGMGVVYEAHDEELDRRVALKLLDPAAAANASLRERFLREARAAARLSHPHIAAVYDAGEGWIAMRLIAGAPLHLAPPADLSTAVRWLRDAALAVQHAHEAGIVHRDLKPHNLLLEGDQLFVTDFGLAKEIAADSSLSLSGHVLGSPSYMAPEQAQGRVHAVDARTDVWGLGATLFQLLAGRPPFVEQDVVRLLRRIVEDEPPRLRALASGVPRDLETVVLKCLEKDPERRFPSARSLAEDLDRWLRGEPVLARRPTIAYRVRKLARRHRGLVALSAASIIALAFLGAAAWNEYAQRTASTQALDLAAFVDAVLDDHALHERHGDKQEARARLDEGVAACRAFLARHDVAQAHWLLGVLERTRGREREARAALDRAIELDPSHAEAALARGLLLAQEFAVARVRLPADPSAGPPAELAGLHAGALADLETAARDAARLSAIDAQLARAELLRLRGDRAGARRAFLEIERLDPVNVAAKAALTQLDVDLGQHDEAWYRAMSQVDLERGLGPAYVARSGIGASDAERAVRQHEVAAAHRAVEAGDRSAEALAVMAVARLRIDDVEGALADFTRALEVEPSNAFAWGNRALVHARRAARRAAEHRLEEALAAWDDAIADVTHALELEPALAGAWNNRAVSRAEKERLLTELGRARAAASERDLAGADLDEAVRLNPRFSLARLNRASQRRRVAERAGADRDFERAEAALHVAGADLQEALRLRADDPAAWLERAFVRDLEADLHVARADLVAAGHARDLARADYDVAVGLATDDGRALALRGLHRGKHGDALGARADFEAALGLPLDRALKARLEQELAAIGR